MYEKHVQFYARAVKTLYSPISTESPQQSRFLPSTSLFALTEILTKLRHLGMKRKLVA